jgi:hypothetical protein
MTVLACPHCGDIIEIRGDVKKRQCDCGGAMEEIADPVKAFGAIFPDRSCRGCGCTDTQACPGGCSWVLLDIATPSGICSQCAEELDWDPMLLMHVCAGIEPAAIESAEVA